MRVGPRRACELLTRKQGKWKGKRALMPSRCLDVPFLLFLDDGAFVDGAEPPD